MKYGIKRVNSGENPGQLKIHWWVSPDIGNRTRRVTGKIEEFGLDGF